MVDTTAYYFYLMKLYLLSHAWHHQNCWLFAYFLAPGGTKEPKDTPFVKAMGWGWGGPKTLPTIGPSRWCRRRVLPTTVAPETTTVIPSARQVTHEWSHPTVRQVSSMTKYVPREKVVPNTRSHQSKNIIPSSQCVQERNPSHKRKRMSPTRISAKFTIITIEWKHHQKMKIWPETRMPPEDEDIVKPSNESIIKSQK